jgi:hypothetical protein
VPPPRSLGPEFAPPPPSLPGRTAYSRVLEDPPWRALLLPAPVSMLRPLPPRTYPACPRLSHLLRYHDAGQPRVFGQRAQPVIRYVKSQLLQLNPLQDLKQEPLHTIKPVETILRSRVDHLGREGIAGEGSAAIKTKMSRE